ncbi:2-oxoacid:acceptor oxidoreductase family protein [Patescibacteria group bacterium]|nr:2-oxoacid:acceptor oxidoreductase family protein [Patescibacteria group bacterium]MBU1029497.1 2-oxoacid:acceptor oxidoreductase family protein [Patescibacteria group bacterium]MBU1916444.1 2-oxoacid:acceptor oxidoreductase family protein [Patescibacteria group bacterium]
MADTYNIIISGEGGQGVLSIAEIIAQAAWLQGKQAVCVPYFSTEKRGGISMAFAQISDRPIAFPKFRQADLWVALSERAVTRLESYLKAGTTVIVNSHLVKDLSKLESWQPRIIDATKIAKEQLHKPRTFNMVILGAMLNFVPGISKEGFAAALDKQFADKYARDPELKKLNQQAFEIGYELIKK